MSKIVYNDDSWLFPNQPFKTHDISYDDIQYLLNCANIDDQWAEDVQKMVQDRDEHPEKRGDFIIDEFRIMNASGTTILFPYGDRIITFCSKRQFFRGENQDFPCSIPSLRRKTMGMSKKQEELMRTVANMRIWQFRKLLWNNINVVPYWEAKLSDVNYKALAQHYGFDTNLLDLTNDFRIALFFATCKYIPEQDCFRPLTEQEINENHKYGIIYHAPNWVIDFISPGGSSEWHFHHMNDEDRWYGLDNGDLDGMAFQIGYQPLMRCHHQSGYVYPLRYGIPLNEESNMKDFGEYAIIVKNPKEFIRRLDKAISNKNYQYICGDVNYHPMTLNNKPVNNKHSMTLGLDKPIIVKDFLKRSKKIDYDAFDKCDSYKNQNEWRIAVNNGVADEQPLRINVGNLSDIIEKVDRRDLANKMRELFLGFEIFSIEKGYYGNISRAEMKEAFYCLGENKGNIMVNIG